MDTAQGISRLIFWIGPALIVAYVMYNGEHQDSNGRVQQDTSAAPMRAFKAAAAGLVVLLIWTLLLGTPDVLNSIIAGMGNGQR